MSKKLFFPHAFTLGMGPGKAASIKAGDVIKIPDEIVSLLKSRHGATENIPDGAEEVSLERRVLPEDQAARLSHPLVERRLKKSDTQTIAEAIHALAEAQKKA